MSREQMEEQLAGLREMIESGNLPSEANSAKEFGGAGVIITKVLDAQTKDWAEDQVLEAGPLEGRPVRRAIISEHAHELSWLFYQLRDLAEGRIDSMSKYDFFGGLGDAAQDYLDKSRENPERKELLLRVLDEARGSLGDEA